MKGNLPPDWIIQINAHGLHDALGLALDVLEPLGPLGAQMLWVAQPVLNRWLPADTVAAVAQALEAPGGVAELRQMLDEHTD
jgi:hypothetical protein